jgi:hypothetical protein
MDEKDYEQLRMAKVVTDATRRQLLYLGVELLRVKGCTNFFARLPGHEHPKEYAGTMEDHRPDRSATSPTEKKKLLILEVVTERELHDQQLINRWTLLKSAAHLHQGELHFLVKAYKQGDKDNQASTLRARLESMDVKPDCIYEVAVA